MPLHLVVDGLPARKKASVKNYVTCTEGRLTLHFPPGYAPDLNPDELVWSHAKRTGTARRPLMKDEKLLECVHEQLQRIGENKNLIRSFFKHPSVALCFRLLSNCKRIFQALLHNAFYLEQALAKLELFVESIRYKVLVMAALSALSALREAYRRARELLTRTRRARSMRRLYKESSPFGDREEAILFWVPGGMPLMLHLEGAIAAALKLRGKKVHAIVCDGIFSACVKREIVDHIPIAEWSKACGECKRACSNTLAELGIEHSFIGDYVSGQELANAKKAALAVTWDSIEVFEYRNVAVGKNIKSAVLRYLKGHDLPTDPRLVQEYAFSGLVCAAAARNALKKLKPSRVFMSHGVYVDWGPALHTALAMQVPITAWMASYLPSRFYFRHVPDGVHISFHNMSDYAWDEISAMPLTEGQKERLDTYLGDRYQRNASFDMKRFKPYVGKTSETLARYRLDRSKPVWGVMAHINWDTVSDYSPMLYESFNEWMSDTVEIAKEVPGVQWLIKVHPAEVWDNPDSGVELLIRRKFPELPGNIRVLPAEENISPLDFYGMVDGAVTVYGTAGLEMAMHGKPVILAGEAHYGKKGFTLDADSREEYRGLMRQAAEIGSLSASQVELAKRYAYCYFILRQIPVSVVSNPDAKWWSFQFDKRENLLPGKDVAVDFLCERLLDGKDFIMSPQLEVEANNFMNTKKLCLK